MKLIEQQVQWLGSEPDGKAMLANIAAAGRVCYQSDGTGKSDEEFVKRIIERGHESVLEHEKLSVIFTTDRGIANELVRHRHCAFSQESTRYCNYSTDRLGGEIKVIRPTWCEHLWNVPSVSGTNVIRWDGYQQEEEKTWLFATLAAEENYLKLIEQGWPAEKARSVLPIGLATTLVMSANMREWRSVMRLRLAKFAHPQIRELMQMTVKMFAKTVPVVFDEFVR